MLTRGQAMERIQPILKSVQDAPIEFFYKSDAVALITECLIKAIEARMYIIDAAAPPEPKGAVGRTDTEQYQAKKAAYDRATAMARQHLVDVDEAQGWVLTGYFYQTLEVMEHNGDGLRDEIAPMIYGMDVDREQHHGRTIVFVKEAPANPLHPSKPVHKIQGLELAQLDLSKGNVDDASDLAEQALKDPAADHGEATYLLAQIDLIHGNPQEGRASFKRPSA